MNRRAHVGQQQEQHRAHIPGCARIAKHEIQTAGVDPYALHRLGRAGEEPPSPAGCPVASYKSSPCFIAGCRPIPYRRSKPSSSIVHWSAASESVRFRQLSCDHRSASRNLDKLLVAHATFHDTHPPSSELALPAPRQVANAASATRTFLAMPDKRERGFLTPPDR
jgi:hypothetical protein